MSAGNVWGWQCGEWRSHPCASLNTFYNKLMYICPIFSTSSLTNSCISQSIFTSVGVVPSRVTSVCNSVFVFSLSTSFSGDHSSLPHCLGTHVQMGAHQDVSLNINALCLLALIPPCSPPQCRSPSCIFLLLMTLPFLHRPGLGGALRCFSSSWFRSNSTRYWMFQIQLLQVLCILHCHVPSVSRCASSICEAPCLLSASCWCC